VLNRNLHRLEQFKHWRKRAKDLKT